MKRIERRRGQATSELAVLIFFVAAALLGIGTYFQRGAQGGLKGNADSIGSQFDTEGKWRTVSRSNSITDENITYSGSCGEQEYATGSAALSGPLDCTAPEAEIPDKEQEWVDCGDWSCL